MSQVPQHTPSSPDAVTFSATSSPRLESPPDNVASLPTSSYPNTVASTAAPSSPDVVAFFTAAALRGFAGNTTPDFRPGQLPDLPHIRNEALRVCLDIPGYLELNPPTQLRVIEGVLHRVLVSTRSSWTLLVATAVETY